MIEDDGYRTSSQYRFWSYTEAQLESIRTTTNSLAADKVRAAFQRARSDANGHNDNHGIDIETLTIAEELEIIKWGCQKIIEMGASMEPVPFPTHVVATAIQYLRRFYLTNSPMTYHPKQIMVCALYLATKSEHYYVSLPTFTTNLGTVTDEDVRAPEFLLMQGLRFTLDVRHPMRGLEGGVAEIKAASPQLKSLANLPAKDIQTRIGSAADKAQILLKTAAQMTDAYFLYTPAQIWMAAVLANDRELLLDFLEHVFSRVGSELDPLKSKLIQVITTCAELLLSYKSPDDDKATRTELNRIGKKLKKCQDPDKIDIVAVAKAKAAEKREGSESDVEKRLKKRKLEREKLEKDGDVFGPEITK